MTTKRKSRLGYAFAKNMNVENDQIDDSNELIVPMPTENKPTEISMPRPTNSGNDASQNQVSLTRLTVQVESRVDRKIEYARVILKKKKQDLINELLSDSLARLNIDFPSQL